jgi:methanogenic corrinoid protein MtbC1
MAAFEVIGGGEHRSALFIQIEIGGRGGQVNIFVGGAPVTQKFADKIGADGYGENAPSAVQLARRAVAPAV